MSGNPNQNPNRNMKLKNLRKPSTNPPRPFRLIRTPGVYESEDTSMEAPAVINIVVPSRINSATSLMMGSHTSTAGVHVVTKSSVKSIQSDKSMKSIRSDTKFPSGSKSQVCGDREKVPLNTKSSADVCCAKAAAEDVSEAQAMSPAVADACPPSKFPAHDMKHLQRQLMKYRGEMERCGDAAKINGQLNEIFLRRLFDIERKANGDIDVMLVTYQEWVEMLLQINEVFINNMEDLESEVAERLDLMKRRLKASSSESNCELTKYKQDVCTLVRLIQNAYHNDNWNMCDMHFQTLTPDEVLGLKNSQMYSAEEGSEHSVQDSNDYPCQNQCNRCPMPPKPPLPPCDSVDQPDSRSRCLFEPECELENVVYMPPMKKSPCSGARDARSWPCDRPTEACGRKPLECSSSQFPRQQPARKPCADNNLDQQNKQQTQANLRALALEVAAKHDEICDLKRQVCCMEDEIQKAQQKIQLKDNVIKELRNDLKCSNAKVENLSRQVCYYSDSPCPKMPPINLEGQHSSRTGSTQASAAPDSCNQQPLYQDDCSQFDSLSQSGQAEKQKLRQLDAELNELFEMASDCKKQNMEFHRKRLSDIFQKSEAEKTDAYRKLDFIRRQLIDLEASGCETSQRCPNDSDSGFSSKCENDQDAKILNAVRKRLRRLNDTVFELKKCVQQLQIENNEVSTCFQTEKSFSARNSDTLKEIADLLCSMTGKQFSYEDIYNGDRCQPNPFCEAIVDMKCEMDETERNLICALTKRNKQIEELQHSQISNDGMNEIDGLQQANESLRCQVEHLQCTIMDQEHRIEQLNGMLQQLQSDAKHKTDCCMQAKDQELHEVRLKLEQANTKAESLACQLESSQKQERFLLCETRKLNDELNESKRKHNDMNVQVHRLASLLKKQESCRTDICGKYEEMEHNYEEQARELRSACTQLDCLQERLSIMDKRQEEHNMERNLLREEVLALKEKEATLLDRQKCLSEQLLKTEKELYTAHDVMKEQQSIMQRNDCTQRDCVKRLQETNADLKQQFTAICSDYKRLEDEYKKQCDIRKQNEKVIESFRKWKEAQLKADDSTRTSFKQYEDHIKMLLEEKQRFLEQYRDLHRDYCTLQNELERIKLCSYSFSNAAPRSELSDNSLSHRMDLIRRASRRLSQQSSSLKCDETSQEASGSKSPGDLK